MAAVRAPALFPVAGRTQPTQIVPPYHDVAPRGATRGATAARRTRGALGP
ncbi:hypothetical protein UO65_6499 [Actinokineospora spheciospongiae]|uniref:Uncharacterized protein n=1 Tax=Actinokineospora spheciospongiae TaxID=909613 RepID=W7ICK8_9PSEU|nr:hypothetical protein UO65_6499 [Actinokineospora spheciospongiae]